ncbi:hypothetical protein [Nocardia mexicana]|uniref:Uncharacterized protein n=1 Tax=Nocardia mexicana TaxID=279262 RepID=A0A370HCJ2_9NOCA|nr:hypothetical protein [Nocardia mexicana]RDI54417.1 hypothetical protein DFR68_102544 [Nocardia mexicana]
MGGPIGVRTQRLSIAMGTARTVTVGCLALLLIPALLLLVLAVLTVLGSTAAILLGVAVIVPIVAFVGHALLYVTRRAAWLEGTTLAVRGAYSTRRANLAHARVWVDSVAENTAVSTGSGMTVVSTGRRIPRLVAQDVQAGATVKLPLRQSNGTLLPAPELHALAAAITSAPRPSPDAEHAHWIAQGLYSLTANPFTGNL